MSGRGKQWFYGANQANDPIVTRLHPRSDKLQVVAMYHTADDEGRTFWAIPGDLPKPGEPEPGMVVKKVKDAFYKEAMIHVARHTSKEAAKDPSRAAQAGLLAVSSVQPGTLSQRGSIVGRSLTVRFRACAAAMIVVSSASLGLDELA